MQSESLLVSLSISCRINNSFDVLESQEFRVKSWMRTTQHYHQSHMKDLMQ